MKRIYILAVAVILAANLFAQKGKKEPVKAPAPQVSLSSAALGKMEARHIGPAVMGGRITAIDGFNNDPRILYVGTAGGLGYGPVFVEAGYHWAMSNVFKGDGVNTNPKVNNLYVAAGFRFLLKN